MELHCFQDFTAHPYLQVKENKDFAYKIRVGGGTDHGRVSTLDSPMARSVVHVP